MIILRSTPGPFEVMFMLAAIVGGVTILFTSYMTVVGRTIPVWMVLYIGIGLVVGGAMSLYGILTKRGVGPLIERAGLALLVILFVTYTGLIFMAVGVRGATSAVFFLAFAAASIARMHQINKAFREAAEELRERGAE
ncbi:hypothetical protein [Amycolatopsis speibonae]|uniref:DUF2304 domain-containing protein n=1 Tax=Amycolatopsis speibonae TaxID=1450224 RepID=A0ABV7P602_9PSEU